MAQTFYASPTDTFTWPNGAIGHRPGGPFDCVGPFAKVRNCPVERAGAILDRSYTCYATGYADTFFTVPACTRIKGKHVRGFFTVRDESIVFVATNRGQSNGSKRAS